MAFLINIDSSTDIASVCLSNGDTILGYAENEKQKEHAAFIHIAIANILRNAQMGLEDIDAFAVTAGPGSYTGLRVTLAAAKGFCYALSKPLITLNTLKVMAVAAKNFQGKQNNLLYCPMIDARRMEVFMALYDSNFQEFMKPQPIILEEHFLDDWLKNYTIVFLGNGSEKFKQLSTHSNCLFINAWGNATHVSILANEAYLSQDFADVTYSKPDYFKEFYSL